MKTRARPQREADRTAAAAANGARTDREMPRGDCAVGHSLSSHLISRAQGARVPILRLRAYTHCRSLVTFHSVGSSMHMDVRPCGHRQRRTHAAAILFRHAPPIRTRPYHLLVSVGSRFVGDTANRLP